MKDDPKQAQTPQPDTSQQAADVTREQIKHIYEETEHPAAPAHTPSHVAPKPPEVPDPQAGHTNTYKRTHKSDFDWRQYHSAWQNYYQEYYRRYYNHLNAKKELEQGGQAKQAVTGDDSDRVEQLRKDVLSQVKRQAKKVRSSHHFWPIMSAAGVGLAFLFLQFNGLLFAQVEAYVSPGAFEGKNLVITDPTGSTAVGPEPRLIIPKINVDMPVDFTVRTLSEPEIQKALEGGAVHYNLPGANALPGQFGNSVILGHSSNDVFAQGQYKFAFVLADHLTPGDTFYVHYNGTRYTYKVTGKKVIKPTELSALQIGNKKPMVTLVTCTPAGTAINRLLVYAEQINPDPSGAKAAEASDPSGSSEQQILPGNAPTLLERIWGLFF